MKANTKKTGTAAAVFTGLALVLLLTACPPGADYPAGSVDENTAVNLNLLVQDVVNNEAERGAGERTGVTVEEDCNLDYDTGIMHCVSTLHFDTYSVNADTVILYGDCTYTIIYSTNFIYDGSFRVIQADQRYDIDWDYELIMEGGYYEYDGTFTVNGRTFDYSGGNG